VRDSQRKLLEIPVFQNNVALVIVYDYYPKSVSLHQKYLSRQESIHYYALGPDVIWSYICQLASAISTVHQQKMAVRILEPSKILITGQNRIRINCCGIFDILTFDDRRPILQYQVHRIHVARRFDAFRSAHIVTSLRNDNGDSRYEQSDGLRIETIY
jgi:hypothetical protein